MPRRALLAFVLVAAVFAAYRPVLEAGFIWNDDTYLTANRTLDGIEGLRLIWTDPVANEQYYPMVFFSYWIEKRLWSLRPLGYHLVNVLLHAASALLLWALLERLRLSGAWLAAAAFALHPLCVESVAWVTERKNTLSLLLSLLAMHAWLRALEEKETTGDSLRRSKKRRPDVAMAVPATWLYVAGFLFFVLALLAKTTASVVPAVLLVLVWWKRGEIRRKDVGTLVPWFAVGAALALHTAWLERTVVRAAGAEWELGLGGRLALAGQVAFFYASKILAPAGLSFVYERWRLDARSIVQWIPSLVALALTVFAWILRKRIGRGPLASLLLFLGVLFPAMGFFNVYPMRFSWVADHFAYQGVAVFAACAVCGASTWAAGWAASPRQAALALGLAAVAVLGALTYRHAKTFRDEETLWTATLERNPACFMCETNYGIWLMENGRDADAAAHLEASLRLKPGEIPTLLNLARLDEKRGRFDASAASLRAALAVDPANTAVLINLATTEARAGRLEDAIAAYRAALRLGSPGDYLAHNGLGAALMRKGGAAESAEAIEHFRAALLLKPDYAHARANLERATKASGVPPPR